jgi:hypothetical protein
MPQSITYERHNIGSKTFTEKLQGNSHHLLVHAQHIHYQYNMEQELLTLSDHLLCWLWCLTMIFSQIRNTYIHPQFLRFALLTLQYSVLCFIVHCSSFSPFFFCWSYIVCPSSVCAFWFPCLGLSNRPIVLYMMTSSFCFTQTWHM